MVKNIYCIEGNIGAGKSTVLKLLENSYKTFPEPVEDWHLLQHYYNDTYSYVFPFNYQVLLSFHKIYEEINNLTGKIFVERCPYTSKKIFIDLNDDIQKNVWKNHHEKSYKELYSIINNKVNIDILFVLYLEPYKCLQRIKIRNRKVEENITLQFLEDLHEKYKKLDKNCPYNVVFIDVDKKTPLEIKNEILSWC